MKLYRYQTNQINTQTTVELIVFNVIAETEKSYGIKLWPYDGKITWVLKAKGKKRFAYPTIEEAELNFKLRTQKYISILKNKLSVATDAFDFDLSKAKLVQ